MKNETLFISWSGEQALNLAQGLKNTVFADIPGPEVFVSPDIQTGSPWPQTLLTELSSASFGLGVITDHSSVAPWVLFEAGFLAGRLGKFLVLTFDTDIPSENPLSLYQQRDGNVFSNIVEVAIQIVRQDLKAIVETAVNSKSDRWNAIVDNSRHRWPRDLRERIYHGMEGVLRSTISSPGLVPVCEEDRCFQEIICKTVEDLSEMLEKVRRENSRENRVITLQRMHYPEYLIHLQNGAGLACNVRAVAVVDDIEEFW